MQIKRVSDSVVLFQEIASAAMDRLGHKTKFYARLREINPLWTNRMFENYSRADATVKALKEDIALELLDRKWAQLGIVTDAHRQGLIKYLELLNCKDPRFLDLQNQAVAPAPFQLPPDQTVPGVRQLSAEDFELGVKEEFFEGEARRYLKGDLPSPRTAVHAAVQREDSRRVQEETEHPGVVLLHGPVAEGTSTVLLQIAFLSVQAGRDVVLLDAVHSDQAGAAILRLRRPLVIVDDANLLKASPSWTRALFEAGGCLLLGCQTRYLRNIRSLFDRRIVNAMPLTRVSIAHASNYVEQIQKFHASDINDPEQIKLLFERGVTLGDGLGGLWPAQYQATRGLFLDKRVEAILDGKPEFLRSISAVAFVGAVFEKAEILRRPTKRIVRSVLEELDIDEEARAQAIGSLQQLPHDLDGEFRFEFGASDFSTASDPPFEFRHPALTECLFRWSFGADDNQRGQFEFNKWPYFLSLIRALRRVRGEDGKTQREAYELLSHMRAVYLYDHRAGGELGRRAALEGKEPGDIVLRAIQHARSSFAPKFSDGSKFSRRMDILEARIRLIEARSVPSDGHLRVRERVQAALATGWAEEDHEVLRAASAIAHDLKCTFTVQRASDVLEANWETLISEAERIERKRATSHSSRPLQASMEYFGMLLNGPKAGALDEWVTSIAAVAARAQFLRAKMWNAQRLEKLRTILGFVRRESKQDRSKINYRIPLGSPDATFPTGIRSIYREFWRELNRRYREEPSFHELVKDHPGRPKILEGVVRSTLEAWIKDEEADSGMWPDGTKDRLVAALSDRDTLPEFAKFFDEAYPKPPDRSEDAA